MYSNLILVVKNLDNNSQNSMCKNIIYYNYHKGGFEMSEESQRIPGPNRDRMRLAHAYVPFQTFTNSYPPEEALRRGTLFPELYMPYRPGRREN